MQSALPTDLAALDFYTAPADLVPAGIDGEADSVVSAGICLGELRSELDKWDGVSLPQVFASPFHIGLMSPVPRRLPIAPPRVHGIHLLRAVLTSPYSLSWRAFPITPSPPPCAK